MSFDYDGDAISDFEWYIAEDKDFNDEDYCPYCGCVLEINFLDMRCLNPNCEFE